MAGLNSTVASSSSSFFQTYMADNYEFAIETTFLLTKFRYPLCGIILYLLSIKVFEPKEEATHKPATAAATAKSPAKSEGKKLGTADYLMILHNLILCVFSFLTFVNTFPHVYKLFTTYGFREAIMTDKFAKLYDTSYGYWSHLFYVSKYYEFVDTWIVMSKGRKPILLQVYHHTGAVVCMWLVIVTRCSCGYFFVVENSFIHTMMYFYYAMSIMGCQCKNKHLITTSQMIQLIVGASGSLVQIFFYGSGMRWEDKFATYVNVFYVTILLGLFLQFYKKSYQSRPPKELKKQE